MGRAIWFIAGIVNNAGVLINKSFLALTASDWQTSFDTNLFGVVVLPGTIPLDGEHAGS
ncbi:MAG: SDR family NAD(P)-dependent oxidoreductase [Saprospiraceae bacterium]